MIDNGPTRLHVMDFLGREVAVLVEGMVRAGRYSITSDLSVESRSIFASFAMLASGIPGRGIDESDR